MAMTWHRRLGRLAGILVSTVVIAWVVLMVAAAVAQETFIFPRWVIPASAWSGPVPSDAEVLTLDTEQGEVPAWFFAGQPDAGLIVFLHGNGVVIDRRVDLARQLAQSGWNVLLPEYRGYGRAHGSPSQAAITSDVMAFIAQVRARDTVGDTLVLYGRSIGTTVAAVLAEDVQADALILQTPPAGIRQMAARYLVPGFMLRSPLDGEAALKALSTPVPTLVIEHGQDRLIPASHVARIAAAAGPHVRHITVGGTHNDYASGEDQRAVHAAVQQLLGDLTSENEMTPDADRASPE